MSQRVHEFKFSIAPQISISHGSKSITQARDKTELIIAYCGINHGRAGKKQDVWALVAHPIMMKGMLPLVRLKCRAQFEHMLEIIERLRAICDASETDHDRLTEYVGVDTEDANRRFGSTAQSFPHLIAAFLWHWYVLLEHFDEFKGLENSDEKVKKCREGWGDQLKESVGVYDLLVKGKWEQFSEWPIGLNLKRLQSAYGDAESHIEVMNRLWQLMWFAKKSILTPSGAKEFMKPGGRVIPEGIHCPSWWTEQGPRARPSEDQRAPEEIIRQHVQESGMTTVEYKQLRCEYIVKVDKTIEQHLDSIANEKDLVDFPQSAKIGGPFDFSGLPQWRNAIREHFKINDYEVFLRSITCKITEKGPNGKRLTMVEVYNYYGLDDFTTVDMANLFNCENEPEGEPEVAIFALTFEPGVLDRWQETIVIDNAYVKAVPRGDVVDGTAPKPAQLTAVSDSPSGFEVEQDIAESERELQDDGEPGTL
ncbi:hypothetical protein AC578_10463 [Pseudocercospora eumusae]|uniref:Uncharacterized protein n=1 Tax=Pseudocercospora eumusae TaxID=321146 RepID=A0A139GUJ7_9PEZI|nr:hypothetical protein AC578_10463 [Pseudocercospora eumusae]